jgi:hypothetical protein
MTEAEKDWQVKMTLARDDLHKLMHSDSYRDVRKHAMRMSSVVEFNPIPELKGKPGKNCNRTACQRPFAFFKHIDNHAYYCFSCTHDINFANLDWSVINGGKYLIELDTEVLTTYLKDNNLSSL